jgi:hypothetical protein
MIFILALLSLWYAWRYSKSSVDPDWAMFNFEGFCGSWYGRDYLDCKTPAIHLWYWAITKVVGRNVARVKFTHHLLIGAMSLIVYLVSGSIWIAFAYLILVNSGWLFAFHGNVGQQPAAFVTLALVIPDPYIAMALWWLALAFEPKLILSFIAWLLVGMLWPQAIITIFFGVVAALATWVFYNTEFIQWMIYQNITIPGRMQKARKSIWKWYLKLPYTAGVTLMLAPWLIAAIYSHALPLFWMAPALYVAITLYGLAIRPNHLIPLIPWVAVGVQSVPGVIIGLALSEWISSLGNLTDPWQRFYPSLVSINKDARIAGEWLRDKPGDIFVNSIHSAVYIYAQKPIQYGMAAQIEIREVAHERRKKMVQSLQESPAKWVVNGPEPLLKFSGEGYTPINKAGEYVIWKRIR